MEYMRKKTCIVLVLLTLQIMQLTLSCVFQVWFKNRRARRKRQRSGSKVSSPSRPGSVWAERKLFTPFLWSWQRVPQPLRDQTHLVQGLRGQRSADCILLSGTSAGWMFAFPLKQFVTAGDPTGHFTVMMHSEAAGKVWNFKLWRTVTCLAHFILYRETCSFIPLNYFFQFLCNLWNQCIKDAVCRF